jgi:hypothetical protein
MIPAFYFDPMRLKDLSVRKREDFLNSKPFPHVVIDDFVNPDILDPQKNPGS